MMNRKELIKIFGTNLRVERARKHFTQEYLSEKANISQEYLARLESEKYNPSIAVAVNLAKALDVTLDTLIPPREYLK